MDSREHDVKYHYGSPAARTHIGVSGIPRPAVNGHDDPLSHQRGGLTRLDTDPWDSPVCRGEQVPGGLWVTLGETKYVVRIISISNPTCTF